jgi:hypothetical protein
MSAMRNVFVVIDREDGRPYVKKGWALRIQAEAELNGLLKFFPEDHEWRRRLHVVEASPFILKEERTSRPMTKADTLRSIQEAGQAHEGNFAPGDAERMEEP